MPRATCRCGHALTVPEDTSERVVCPSCGARVRIRHKVAAAEAPADGYLRFFCPCGRRLKVDAADPPPTGKCPDCGRIVPVPSSSFGARQPGHPEAVTQELAAVDRAALERWVVSHRAEVADTAALPTTSFPPPTESDRDEVGLRVCPNCGRPIHMGSDTCRGCGTVVPRR